jgi:hypothetical protein
MDKPQNRFGRAKRPLAALVAALGLLGAQGALATDPGAKPGELPINPPTVLVGGEHGGNASAQAQMDAAQDSADASYKADMQRCSAMSGNDRDVCEDKAKGDRDSAKAHAKADYKGTPDTRYDAAMTRAKSDRKIDLERCGAMKGNDKDVCEKEAQARFVRAQGDAKVLKAGGDAQQQ